MSDATDPPSSDPLSSAAEAFPEAGVLFTSSPSALEQVKDQCVVVLDTNVLLVPYTISPKSLDDIRATYRRLIDQNRLVVPGQVAREFVANKAGRVGDVFKSLSKRRNSLPTLGGGRYPLLEGLGAYQRALQLERTIDEHIREYRDVLGQVLSEIRTWSWNDPVSNMYRELFTEAVVVDPPLSAKEFENDLGRRTKHRIPPGFKDAAKPDGGAGDLVIWHTILYVGASRKASVLFVSGDEKSDWWYRAENEALYPRFELIDEFRRATGGHTLNAGSFPEFLNLYGAEEQVVEEVRKAEEETREPRVSQVGRVLESEAAAEKAVAAWIRATMSPTEFQERRREFPNFVVVDEKGKRIGFEVKPVFQIPHMAIAVHRLREVAFKGYYAVNERQLDEFHVVFVATSEEEALNYASRLQSRRGTLPPTNVIVGYLSSGGAFVVAREFRWGARNIPSI